jgi:hypothetical protein
MLELKAQPSARYARIKHPIWQYSQPDQQIRWLAFACFDRLLSQMDFTFDWPPLSLHTNL